MSGEEKKSKEANIPEHEPDNIEADETSSNADATDQEHKNCTSNTKESALNLSVSSVVMNV